MTLPLVSLPPDGIAAMAMQRTWPTAVAVARDGTEQRVAHAVAPREVVRYTLTEAATRVMRDALAALLAADTTTVDPANADDPTAQRTALRVRVPRWEDAVPLAAPAAPGDTTLALVDAVTGRRFLPSGDVLFWVPNDPTAPTTVTATLGSGAIADTDTTLTLAAALPGGRTWPASTGVIPIATGWVRLEPLEHAGGVASAVLVVTRDVSLAGDRGGSDGDWIAPVVAAIDLQVLDTRNGDALSPGQHRRLVVTCRDAAGQVVPPPGPLVWTKSDVVGGGATFLTVRPDVVRADLGYVFADESAIDGAAIPGAIGGSVGCSVTVTEPVSGLSTFIGFLYY